MKFVLCKYLYKCIQMCVFPRFPCRNDIENFRFLCVCLYIFRNGHCVKFVLFFVLLFESCVAINIWATQCSNRWMMMMTRRKCVRVVLCKHFSLKNAYSTHTNTEILQIETTIMNIWGAANNHHHDYYHDYHPHNKRLSALRFVHCSKEKDAKTCA